MAQSYRVTAATLAIAGLTRLPCDRTDQRYQKLILYMSKFNLLMTTVKLAVFNRKCEFCGFAPTSQKLDAVRTVVCTTNGD